MAGAEARADRADRRIDKFDKKLEAPRRLVESGMKLVVRLGTRMNSLQKAQEDSLRRFNVPPNGNGHNGRKRGVVQRPASSQIYSNISPPSIQDDAVRSSMVHLTDQGAA